MEEKNDLNQNKLSKLNSTEKTTVCTFTLDSLLHPLTAEPLKVGTLLAKTSDCGSDTEAILAAILESCAHGEYHILAAPEYSFFPFSGPLNEQQVQAYLEDLKEAGRHNGTLVIPGTFVWQKEGQLFNTCFALYQGEVIHQHHKSKNGGESGIASRYGLSATFGSELGLFDWGGLKLGIEICAECELLHNWGNKDRDLLFLLSCGLEEADLRAGADAVREQGYSILVDGSWPPCGNAVKIRRQKNILSTQEIIDYFTR